MPELALIEGRLWLVKEREDHLLPNVLQSLGEPFLNTPTECTSSSLLSLLNTLHNLWYVAHTFKRHTNTLYVHLCLSVYKIFVDVWIWLWILVTYFFSLFLSLFSFFCLYPGTKVTHSCCW